MSYPRRTAGKAQKISAGGWNAAMDAAEAFDVDSRVWRLPHGDAAFYRGSLIEVVNKSGAHRKRGEILGLDTWLHDLDDGHDIYLNELFDLTCLKGILPTTASHADKFVILPTDLADQEVGPAIIAGVAIARVNISSTSHKFATVKDSDATMLQSADSGRGRILKAETGTGTKWCVLELGPSAPVIHRGTADAAIAKGASGTISRYTDGTNTDSTINDTVQNDVAAVASGGIVTYVQLGSNFYLVALELAAALELHRGTTDAAINKGASGTVSRYTDGTSTDSGTNDTVFNDFANVGSGKVVAYMKLGSNYYMIAAECPLT